MAQTARDIRRRDRRKAEKYGAWAIGIDLRGRHGMHPTGRNNGNWKRGAVHGNHTATMARARAKAVAKGICSRCFGAPAKAPYVSCEPCLVIGRLKHKAHYEAVGRARYFAKKRAKQGLAPVRHAPIIAGYVPPKGSIALSLLGTMR